MTEVLDTDAALWALTPEWDALWHSVPGASPFSHPAWLLPWWRQFGTGQPRVAVQPGRHKIEVFAFMGTEALKSTTIDTGTQKELSIGVDASGAAECYNCAAANAPGSPGN